MYKQQDTGALLAPSDYLLPFPFFFFGASGPMPCSPYRGTIFIAPNFFFLGAAAFLLSGFFLQVRGPIAVSGAPVRTSQIDVRQLHDKYKRGVVYALVLLALLLLPLLLCLLLRYPDALRTQPCTHISKPPQPKECRLKPPATKTQRRGQPVAP